MPGRREYLLEAAYRYVLEHGLTDLSLRPLAQAIGSSPRVLLFVFGSKDALVRTLLDRARQDELAVLDRIRASSIRQPGERALAIWEWLADPGHCGLLTLWVEAYARSLVEPSGPLGSFARQTVTDWLALLGGPDNRDTAIATALLAVLRGGMLDLLATGDRARVDASVRRAVALVSPGPS